MLKGDLLLKRATILVACFILLLFIGIVISLCHSSALAWHSFGFGFIWHHEWNPGLNHFSALNTILGTLITSAIALLFGFPISVLIASFATKLAPHLLRGMIAFCLQLMAGITSIIYGMWGLFILAPFLAQHVQPAISAILGHIPLIGSWFVGPPMGINLFTAGIILAIMIIPLLTTMMVDLMRRVPHDLQEAAYAQGATHWEVIRRINIPFIKKGLMGSTMLGLGRALGETMAVTFVIGNAHRLPSSLFLPGNTIASTIANEFTEATSPIYSSSLMALGLILMVITFITIICARLLLNKEK